MNPILLAVLIVTVIGLIGAVILVAASIFMYVPVDERVEQITGCLPGANCGACGCAGCADYAKTIVEDGNAVNKCVPGGAKVAGEIAAIMGVEAGASVPMKAVVACSGTCGKTGKRFEFEGPAQLPGGQGPVRRPTATVSSAAWATATASASVPSTPSMWWTAWPWWTGRNAPAAVPVPRPAPTPSSASSRSTSASLWCCARTRTRALRPGRPVPPAASAA